MKDVNKVILVGRLGEDPSHKTTANGGSLTRFSVATSYPKRSDSLGEAQVETTWHSVVTWGKRADACRDFLRKGSSVYVEGTLKKSKFEGRDGIERVSVEIVADDISFLGKKAS
ncbi:MAG: hypothetical protein CL678_06890 [Bdellovibrionaceae bacterium]|nr:hypothetical protein [Pseudobdellovibrionaceae bacterium]|tara:strand:+ start:2339 stop:2680 length:342 start_codon:yes stop_codon:yes gene_type:complete